MPRNPVSLSDHSARKAWTPVILLMLVAMLLRLYRTSLPDHYLLAGADGPYLALQVRAILEHGRLAFPDMPGLFWLDAALAWVLHVFHVGDLNSSVLMAIRIMDILLPPLAAVPVYLISRGLRRGGADDKWSWLTIAYAILGFTPAVVFSYQLQKNALGVVWMFAVLLFMVRFLKSRSNRQLIWAGLALTGCALTHFGCFAITLLLCIILVLLDAKGAMERNALLHGKRLLSFVLILSLAVGLVAAFDPQRSWRWVSLPMHLFEWPVILYRLKGLGGVLQGWTLVSVVIAHVLAILGMIILVMERRRLADMDRSIGWAMSIATLFMTSPMLGLEWANRMYLLAYIPLTILWSVMFASVCSVWWKRIAAILMTGSLMFSLMNSLLMNAPMSIDIPSHDAFKALQAQAGINSEDIIVARQDLQLLANWTFSCRGIAKYLFTKKDYPDDGHVYVIRQVKGKSPWIRSAEPTSFADERPVLLNEYYEVTTLGSDKGLPEVPEQIFRGVRGKLLNLRDGAFDVLQISTGRLRTVRVQWPEGFDPASLNGSQVEVNGDWLPFSLDIRAKHITVIR